MDSVNGLYFAQLDFINFFCKAQFYYSSPTWNARQSSRSTRKRSSKHWSVFDLRELSSQLILFIILEEEPINLELDSQNEPMIEPISNTKPKKLVIEEIDDENDIIEVKINRQDENEKSSIFSTNGLNTQNGNFIHSDFCQIVSTH